MTRPDRSPDPWDDLLAFVAAVIAMVGEYVRWVTKRGERAAAARYWDAVGHHRPAEQQAERLRLAGRPLLRPETQAQRDVLAARVQPLYDQDELARRRAEKDGGAA